MPGAGQVDRFYQARITARIMDTLKGIKREILLGLAVFGRPLIGRQSDRRGSPVDRANNRR